MAVQLCNTGWAEKNGRYFRPQYLPSQESYISLIGIKRKFEQFCIWSFQNESTEDIRKIKLHNYVVRLPKNANGSRSLLIWNLVAQYFN